MSPVSHAAVSTSEHAGPTGVEWPPPPRHEGAVGKGYFCDKGNEALPKRWNPALLEKPGLDAGKPGLDAFGPARRTSFLATGVRRARRPESNSAAATTWGPGRDG